MKVSTSVIMRELDRRAVFEYGISGLVLMENAGRGVADIALKRLGDKFSRGAAVVSGCGNNGGDGFVVARHLANRGIEVDVFLLGEAKNVCDGEARVNLDILRKMGIGLVEVTRDEDVLALASSIEKRGVAIDALLGTGIEREVTGLHDRAIRAINRGRERGVCVVVSVDMPSGVSADTGKILGVAVRADLTITFALPKVGALIYPGADYVGELVVVDISMPSRLIEELGITKNVLSPSWFYPLLERRRPDSHKGDFGHLLIVAGSPGKTGAAALCASGALLAGAGLVTVGVPSSLNSVFEVKLTEAMTEPLPDDAGFFTSSAIDRIFELIDGKEGRGMDAVAIGPGMGTSKGSREVVRGLISECNVPLVIDADGLNVVACDPEILRERKSDIIITPHPGEMARLIKKTPKDVQEDRIGVAQGFAEQYGVFVVLKGARTIIASPAGEIFISLNGNPGMASGGVGDVLTGLIGGFLASSRNPIVASCAGVFIHGAAGDHAREKTGEISLTASDILAAIPSIIRLLSEKDASPRFIKAPLCLAESYI